MAKQKEDLEHAMKNITAQNKREICDKERECLNKKQQLMRGGWQRLSSVTMGFSSPASSHAADAVTELQAGRMGCGKNQPCQVLSKCLTIIILSALIFQVLYKYEPIRLHNCKKSGSNMVLQPISLGKREVDDHPQHLLQCLCAQRSLELGMLGVSRMRSQSG